MPEGHSVHRITRQFERNFVGHVVQASSPQGRFAEGAADLDGRRMTDARAVGKQMFLGFEDDRWLRVHLGMYGAWDFSGVKSVITSVAGSPTAISPQRTENVENSVAEVGTGFNFTLAVTWRRPRVVAFQPPPLGCAAEQTTWLSVTASTSSGCVA